MYDFLCDQVVSRSVSRSVGRMKTTATNFVFRRDRTERADLLLQQQSQRDYAHTCTHIHILHHAKTSRIVAA